MKEGEAGRNDFLVAMYNQLMNDINRHIVIVWQSIATLAATIAALSLVKDNVLPLDFSVALIIVVVIWMQLNLLDASYWYNRNLAMIANIERIFLEKDDLKKIHYYFGSHRPENRMISHLKVQAYLGYGVAAIFLFLSYYVNYHPKIVQGQPFEIGLINAIPWLLALAGLWLIQRTSHDNRLKYKEFIENSPGIDLDTGDIKYGIGHGFRNNPP
jgi:hypothetical protein